METVIDYDEYIANAIVTTPEYVAVFNPTTGEIISIGPRHAFKSEIHQIPIDREIAELIIEGKIRITSYIVNMQSGILELIETTTAVMIDNLLHRIINKEWSEISNPDIYIIYNSNNHSLQFEMSEELEGTWKLGKEFKPVIRKILWDSETVMNFLITDYNDPNVLYKLISMTIRDLLSRPTIVEIADLPPKFSIYTRRIFKNYVVEYI